MADYLGADCFAVSVAPVRTPSRLSEEGRDAVGKHLKFAKHLHVETRILEGDDPAGTIVDFARRNQITQIILSRNSNSSWNRLFGGNLILQIVEKAKDIRVIIVADRKRHRKTAGND